MQTTSRMTPRANPLPFSHLDDAVAAAIRASRIDADLTQRQVAARLPWDVSVYIKRDAGRRRITVPQFILIAYALDRSPTDLLSRVLLEYSCHSSRTYLKIVLAEYRWPQAGRIRGSWPDSIPNE
jgi:transcriptional regulator with XRE-family HTH domain